MVKQNKQSKSLLQWCSLPGRWIECRMYRPLGWISPLETFSNSAYFSARASTWSVACGLVAKKRSTLDSCAIIDALFGSAVPIDIDPNYPAHRDQLLPCWCGRQTTVPINAYSAMWLDSAIQCWHQSASKHRTAWPWLRGQSGLWLLYKYEYG